MLLLLFDGFQLLESSAVTGDLSTAKQELAKKKKKKKKKKKEKEKEKEKDIQAKDRKARTVVLTFAVSKTQDPAV